MTAVSARRSSATSAAAVHGRQSAVRAGPPVIALVGRPNVGKSTFFAHATGRYAETANVPGTTVGIDRREVRIDGQRAVLVDLPGVLTLSDGSQGLPPLWELLAGQRADAVVVLVDAGDIARHLALVLACRDLGSPLVVAANLADEADARGIELDRGRLSQLLAAPVHRAIGRRGVGVREVLSAALRAASCGGPGGAHRAMPALLPYRARTARHIWALADRISRGSPGDAVTQPLMAAVGAGAVTPVAAATIAAADLLEAERWRIADQWAAGVERHRGTAVPAADRLARAITAPWPGLAVLAIVTLASLSATMAIGAFLSTVLGAVWSAVASPLLGDAVRALVPVPALASALLWALDSGLLAMLSVGIPFVLSFYLILAALEDSGYLAAAAVLTDRVFNVFGLPGRAAIPILAATGCNVPAIYGTRVLASRRERLLASFLIVLTPCSARSAVVVAALAPLAGPGAALAAFGVVASITVSAGVAANALVPGRSSPLVLELPRLRMPVARQVAQKAAFRSRSFVRTATPVMVAASFVLGLAYETGAIAPFQEAIGPAVSGLLGLPPVTGVAIVLAFLRKELALQLLLVLAIAAHGPGASSLAAFMTPGQVFVYVVVTAVSFPCVATLATLADELGWPSAVAISGAALGTALAAGAILARLVGIA